MFENIINTVIQKQKELPFNKCMELSQAYYECIYGSMENINQRICRLKEEGVTDYDIPKTLWDEIGKIFSLFKNIATSKNLKSFFEAANKLDDSTKDFSPDEIILLQNLVNNQARLTATLMKLLFGIDVEKTTKEELIEVCLKHVYVSKQDIADEFEVDKTVLNKWLEYFFEDRFRGKRKINFNDYLEIFEAFLLLADEGSFNVDFHKEKYFKRIKKGMNYSKTDIATFCDSDLKTLRSQVRDMAIYSLIDKLPPSIAITIIEKMGNTPNF
jgi:hypothetical protein